MIEKTLSDIVQKLKLGKYPNEASISQGVVVRILQALEWPTWEPDILKQEYSLEGRRVDYALCHPPNKPIVFIEVKNPGHAMEGERQLFEYAFHVGVPMAILSDGQEWHFYLPAEQGLYQERKVYNLNILEREIAESANRLKRYLQYDAVISGNAISNARNDYKAVAKKRELERHLPQAWKALISEEDELLIDLICDKVEDLCGYKPEPDMVSDFLKGMAASSATYPTPHPISTSPPVPMPDRQPNKMRKGRFGFEVRGEFHAGKNASDTMVKLFKKLVAADPSFLDRFSARKHGRKRRFVSNDKMELYPGRPDLCEEHSLQLVSGWWIGTNYSRENIRKIIKLACEVANLSYGKDLILYLGEGE